MREHAAGVAGDEEAFLDEHGEILVELAGHLHVPARLGKLMATDAAVASAALQERPEFLGETFLHHLAIAVLEEVKVVASRRRSREGNDGIDAEAGQEKLLVHRRFSATDRQRITAR